MTPKREYPDHSNLPIPPSLLPEGYKPQKKAHNTTYRVSEEKRIAQEKRLAELRRIRAERRLFNETWFKIDKEQARIEQELRKENELDMEIAWKVIDREQKRIDRENRIDSENKARAERRIRKKEGKLREERERIEAREEARAAREERKLSRQTWVVLDREQRRIDRENAKQAPVVPYVPQSFVGKINIHTGELDTESPLGKDTLMFIVKYDSGESHITLFGKKGHNMDFDLNYVATEEEIQAFVYKRMQTYNSLLGV